MEAIKQFSTCSALYSKYRPIYPKELFYWLNDITPAHDCALDCGTGNGQAANELALFFNQVIAIDASFNQLREAKPHPKIRYYCMRAERTSFKDNSIDLIISASAAHWFNLKKFYTESKRLLKPDSRIIIWTYSWPEAIDKKIQEELLNIKNYLMPYWPKESLLHLNKYNSIPFPFDEISPPDFKFEVEWDIDQLLNFFLTWASIRKYTETVDRDYIKKIKEKLISSWPNTKKAQFIFPLYIKAGKT